MFCSSRLTALGLHIVLAVLFLFVSGFVQITSDQYFFVNAAYAQASDEAKQKPRQRTRRTPALRENIYKKLSKSQELSEAGKYAEATKVLELLRKDKSLNSYEIAMMWNFTAYIYSAQEKYTQALSAFQKVLAQKNLPEALELNTLFSVGQLYLAEEKYSQAVSTLKKWFSLAKNPGASSYVLLAQAYFQMEDFKSAVQSVEKALSITKKQEGQPKEQWLLIMRAAYYELNNIPKVIEALEMLTNLYPKGQYFAQLSGLYGDRNNEKRQLLVIEAAYDGGYLNKENQYLALASLLLSNDVPYKAARVVEKGIKKKIIKESVNNLRMLAQAWFLAQEPRKSIPVLKKAAQKSEDGELYVRLGSSYANLDDWSNCASSIRAGIKKGKVKRVDSANVTLGSCLYNSDDLDGAITAFERARKDKRSDKVAIQWLNFLKSEKDRRQRLANSLL